MLLIAGVTVFFNWDSILVHTTRHLLAMQINGTAFPEDQKQSIVGHLDRLVAGFQEGRVTPEGTGRAFEQIRDGVALRLDIVHLFRDRYLSPSTLGESEKQSGRATLDRVARGVVEGKLSKMVLSDIVGRLRTAAGTQRMDLPAAELREFLGDLQLRADTAGVSKDPYTLDPAAEIGKLVDRALGG